MIYYGGKLRILAKKVYLRIFGPRFAMARVEDRYHVKFTNSGDGERNSSIVNVLFTCSYSAYIYTFATNTRIDNKYKWIRKSIRKCNPPIEHNIWILSFDSFVYHFQVLQQLCIVCNCRTKSSNSYSKITNINTTGQKPSGKISKWNWQTVSHISGSSNFPTK